MPLALSDRHQASLMTTSNLQKQDEEQRAPGANRRRRREPVEAQSRKRHDGCLHPRIRPDADCPIVTWANQAAAMGSIDIAHIPSQPDPRHRVKKDVRFHS